MDFNTWTGYFLNHLLPPNHELYNFPNELPNNIDWKKDLDSGIYLTADNPIDVNFLWAYKVLRLHVNPESEERELLSEPVPIVVIKYDYGNFQGSQPEKQDLILSSYYREDENAPIELKPYKTLYNPLNKPGAKDKLVSRRRTTAEAYIKQRANEIDRTTEYLFATYGENKARELGLKQLNLTLNIEQFFEQFATEMFVYLKSGSLKINEAIATLMQSDRADGAWLSEEIPIAQDDRGNLTFAVTGRIIMDIFARSVAPVTVAQIDKIVSDSTLSDYFLEKLPGN